MVYQAKKIVNNLSVFANKMGVSSETRANTLSFIKSLINVDPLRQTKFELSFKVQKNGEISNKIRLLNLDAALYSFSSPHLYLKRLRSFEQIIGNKINNPAKKDLFSVLSAVADTPLDLYFGADIKDDFYLFAFWLILGGVRPDGKINFSPHSEEIIKKIFFELNVNPIFSLKPEKILNLGFDIDNQDLFYKIYYFLDERDKTFSKQMRDIRQALKNDYRYWFFVSERYNIKENKCQRKKLFLEFLDVLHTYDRKTQRVLDLVLKLGGCRCSGSDIFRIISSINGRITLVAFETDGLLTFYIGLLH